MARIAKRWWFWLAMSTAVPVLVLLIYFAASAKEESHVASVESVLRRVRVGMTAKGVNELVGNPSFLPASALDDLDRAMFIWQTKSRFAKHKHESIALEFVYGKVATVNIIDLGPDQRTLCERIQDEYDFQRYKLGW